MHCITLKTSCLFILAVIVTGPATAAEPVIREIASDVDHNHCTTRQFQHMTFHHQGVWFVFYSDGKDLRYQTSDNGGKDWQLDPDAVDAAPNGSTSFDVLKLGDRVYVSYAIYPLGRYDANAPYAKDPARRGEYTVQGRVKMGRIEKRSIRWLKNIDPGFTPDYSNLVQDTAGYFWIFSRESGQGVAYRTGKANEIDRWLPPSVCVPVSGRHAMDAAALDDGRIYVASMLTTDGKVYGNLYDGTTWGDRAVLIADNVTHVAGDDRRLAIDCDPVNRQLHLIYVDAANTLRYRSLSAPYSTQDWNPKLARPGQRLATSVFTCALSVDSSRSPYGLAITYGVQRHAGRDQRERTGELYVQRFDGESWQGEPRLVSQPGSTRNWYPNVNRDIRDGWCVMYSRSTDPDQLQKPLAVMVSVVDGAE